MTVLLLENEVVMIQKYPAKLSVGSCAAIVCFSMWNRALGRRITCIQCAQLGL
jgi:hypothetical protein